jgi:Ca2+-binding RTX toxin-like protein
MPKAAPAYGVTPEAEDPLQFHAAAAATPIIAEQEPNDSLGASQRLDRDAFAVAENPKLEDDSLPSVAVTGYVSSLYDRDYFSVHLEQGESLHLNIDTWKGADWAGEGVFYTLYDARGVAIGSYGTPDSTTFVATTSGIHTVAIHAPRSNFPDKDPPDSGSYTAYLSISPAVDTEASYLLSGFRWNQLDLTYSFPTSSSDYGDGTYDGQPQSNFSSFNSSQRLAVEQIYGGLSGLTNLTFREAESPGGGTLRFGMNDQITNGYYPGYGDGSYGDSFYQYTVNFTDLRLGSHAHFVLLHEIGHTLGLKHGHEDYPYAALPPEKDSLEFSLMTYRFYEGGPLVGFAPEHWPQTYMMNDIATLQYLYGADFATNGGNTTYKWDSMTGQMYVNGVGQRSPDGNYVFMTVWDGGGKDTYDLSNYAGGVTVDLRPGGWTTTSSDQLVNLNGNPDEAPVYARGNIANALLYQGDMRSLIENAVGGAGNDAIGGNQTANRLTGNAGNDTLDGREADDVLEGGLGNDLLVGGAGVDAASYAGAASAVSVNLALAGAQDTGGAGSDTLTGIENLLGSAHADALRGNVGANRLNGGAGADTLEGGAGDDTYVVDVAGDKVVEAAGGGVDTVESGIGYTLGAELENLSLTGTAAINGTGNTLANRLAGNSGNNVLNGAAGADVMKGGLGDDSYFVDNAGDIVAESASQGTDTVSSSVSYALTGYAGDVENLSLSGTAAINGTGNALANRIVGNAGNNVLNGAAGADVMKGGAGDDTFFVDNSGDIVSETAAQGLDTVNSTVSFSLTGYAGDVENLSLTGTAAINGTGNTLANRLAGNSGNNVLNGAAGADVMKGGAGDDSYVVDNAGDIVSESASQGTDTVSSSVSYALTGYAGNVENLTLSGTAAINGTGNALANRIVGNAGNNVLNGAAGADVMKGGAGDDTFFVDNSGDIVSETAAQGLDTVNSTVSFSLTGYAGDVENLSLSGSGAVNGTGNALANRILGSSVANTLKGAGGDDVLDGRGGRDICWGGAGHDTFQFTAPVAGSNAATIADFAVADDTIALSRAAFTALAADGTLAASAFVTGTAAADADDRVVYDTATGRIWYDGDGSGAGAAVLFAQVSAGTALTSLDFQVYTPLA